MLAELDAPQRALVAKVLLDRVGRPDLWSSTGPTATAVRLLKIEGTSLPQDQRLVLLFAFDLWNGSGRLGLLDLLQLSRSNAPLLGTVGRLLEAIALGATEVQIWADRQLRPPNAR